MLTRSLVFPASYFSGADVAVYFGDAYVDDVAGLSFVVQQQLQPVFGYGSYTFDAILKGTRLVEGSFRIPFRQAGYLLAVAREASARTPATASDLKSKRTDLPFRYSFEWHLTSENPEEDLMEAIKKASPTVLETLAKQLQKEAWGDQETQPQPPATARGPLFPGGFSITILYGVPPPPQVAEALGTGFLPAGTLLRLEGVQLGSVVQQIDPSGNPVWEDYSFLAKDLAVLPEGVKVGG